MSFGGFCAIDTHIPASEVIIEGEQNGMIADIRYTQVIKTNADTKQLTYHFPTQGNFCIYKLIFDVGGNIVDLKLKVRNLNAISQTFTKPSIYPIGSVPAQTEVKVIAFCAFEANLEDQQTILTNFPLDTMLPDCSITNLQSDSAKISVNLKINQNVPIKEVFTDCNCAFERIDEYNAKISIEEIPKNLSSLLIRTKLESPFTGIAFKTPLTTVVSFAPLIEKIEIPDNEYIFLVENSSQMQGPRIDKLKSCLEIVVRSLPPKSIFNIIKFSNKHSPLWMKSSQLEPSTFKDAIKFIQNISDSGADIQGLLPALEFIFKEKPKTKRQIFIVTQGTPDRQTEIFELFEQHKSDTRCYPIGFGFHVDSYFIETLAMNTLGRYELVLENEDLASKVMFLLRHSMVECFNIEEINVPEFQKSSIQPIYPCSNKNLFFKTSDFGDNITLKGQFKNELLEYTIPVAKDVWESNCIHSLQAFHLIQKYQSNIATEEYVVDLSIENNILSDVTCYINVIDNRVFESNNIRNVNQKKHNNITKSKTPKFDYVMLLLQQDPAGFWSKSKKLLKLLDKKDYPNFKEAKSVNKKDKVIPTVAAIALLYKKALQYRDAWIFIEEKAMKWLSSINGSMKWNEVISGVVQTL
ncbi:von Willebrand factor type A domain containing protein [Histomonas meleagridis]|uniref:von Willebrand factor type A domain containing protein n=1 Tax=Histomonas meleagridis TaxID=135588 RepID=UPI003559995B|nr:von Willebrand factor type A domain containing protein [Histomonas meleagridis]KAH0798095.1 von Willebrand factor type A domain containing protein [Histomonas meleagridis]